MGQKPDSATHKPRNLRSIFLAILQLAHQKNVDSAAQAIWLSQEGAACVSTASTWQVSKCQLPLEHWKPVKF